MTIPAIAPGLSPDPPLGVFVGGSPSGLELAAPGNAGFVLVLDEVEDVELEDWPTTAASLNNFLGSLQQLCSSSGLQHQLSLLQFARDG